MPYEMSDEKEDTNAKNVNTNSCCESENADQTELSAPGESSRMEGFIDIHHPSERLGTPVEECGENNRRAGGSTIAEVSGKLSHQHIDSEDEYVSAEEESEGDGGLDIPGDRFYACESEGGGDNKNVQEHAVERDVNERQEDDSSENSEDGACGNEDLDEEKGKDKAEVDVEDDEYRKKIEESLSDDEKLERKNKAQEIKNRGNQMFREGSYRDAVSLYNEALQICPLCFVKERSIMFSNRAACQMKLDETDAAIKSCSKALELHPHYMKALLRRAELYEKADKLDEALADYQKAVELDPSQHAARHAVLRLADQVKERNEKLKTEMLGKLKDLGNMILKPFGMSTENFQLNQDPNTGSYSVNFQQDAQQK